MSKLTNPYTHFYLYAKGHYQRDGLIADLRAITSKSYGWDQPDEWPGNTQDIVAILLKLTYMHLTNEREFAEFANSLHPDEAWRSGGLKNESYPIRLLRCCLSVLTLTIADVLLLGEPDPSILPLTSENEN